MKLQSRRNDNTESIQAQYLDFLIIICSNISPNLRENINIVYAFKPDLSDNYSRNILNILGYSKDCIGFSHSNWNKILLYWYYTPGIRTPVDTSGYYSTLF